MVNSDQRTISLGMLKARLFRTACPIVHFYMVLVFLYVTCERLLRPLLSRETRVVVVNHEELWMTKSEAYALIRHMHSIRTYLEYSSGGSTLNIVPLAMRRAVSIEYDGTWCDKVRKKLRGRPVEYNCIPRQHRLGHKGRYEDFIPYVDRIDTLGEEEWDFVFIAGRARVACAVKTPAYITPHSVVTIHDFQRTRGEYSAILFFYDVTEKSHVPSQPGIAFLLRKPRFHAFQRNTSAVQAIVDTGEESYKLRECGKMPAVFDNIFSPFESGE